MLAEDRGTVPVRGITVIGDLSHPGSNSKTLRDFISSLEDAGIPWQSFNTRFKPLVPESDYRRFVTPPGEFDIRRYTHIVEMFRSPLPANPVKCRARIAFWEGEYGICEVWPYLRGTDPVIAMSDFNLEYFRREFGAENVRKILYPLRPVKAAVAARTDRRFTVLFTFDFGSFRRKNPHAAMRAFAKAFPVERDVLLRFKTMGAKTHRRELEELRALASDLGIADRFEVIAEYLPHDELYSLTANCDVYISLHRGEGFGIGMAEAMLFAKPVVATGWSANAEFVREGVALPVRYRMVSVRANEYFESMREWAEADVDDAAAKLRRLYEDPQYRSELGAKAKAFVEEHFSIDRFRESVDAFLG